MRDNPYGAVPAENPGNIRQAMNRVDPRDRSLLGAAWYAGYLAHAGRAGCAAVTLAATAGPSGIVYSKQEHAQPWFDDARPAVMPSFFVIAGCAGLAGAKVHEATISVPRKVQALAVSRSDRKVLWLANLTGEPQEVRLTGVGASARARRLNTETFETACRSPADLLWEPLRRSTFTLSPYEVMELRTDR
jgi:hypothetical protein